jgi:hypothetical protein
MLSPYRIENALVPAAILFDGIRIYELTSGRPINSSEVNTSAKPI